MRELARSQQRRIAERQQVALAHPCASAEDTVDHRYHTVEQGRWSTLLTVNK